jgi:hypothetical protein
MVAGGVGMIGLVVSNAMDSFPPSTNDLVVYRLSDGLRALPGDHEHRRSDRLLPKKSGP